MSIWSRFRPARVLSPPELPGDQSRDGQRLSGLGTGPYGLSIEDNRREALCRTRTPRRPPSPPNTGRSRRPDAPRYPWPPTMCLELEDPGFDASVRNQVPKRRRIVVARVLKVPDRVALAQPDAKK
jgi:hypothetical protein